MSSIPYQTVSDEITIFPPPGTQPGDTFEAVIMSDSIGEKGIQIGDICIVYRTADIQKDDLALIYTGEDFQYIGILDFDDFYYHLLEHDDYEAQEELNAHLLSW